MEEVKQLWESQSSAEAEGWEQSARKKTEDVTRREPIPVEKSSEFAFKGVPAPKSRSREEIEAIIDKDYVPSLRRLHWLYNLRPSEAPLSSPRPVIAGIDDIPATLPLYADPQLVDHIAAVKSSFDSVDKVQFYRARDATNPYEAIGNLGFLDRSAVKLLELDLLAGLCDHRNLSYRLRFVDLCGGPGAFSEYVYWARGGDLAAEGWGVTLRKNGDWAWNLSTVPHANFHAFYGADGTGDITKEQNITALADEIMAATSGIGCNLVVADGALSVEGREQYQEQAHSHLFLNEVIAGLSCLARGGDFVMKLFDVYRPFTLGLLNILYEHFDRITIAKPIESRPANSERYVICKHLRHQPSEDLLLLLLDVNNAFRSLKAGQDVVSLMPLERMDSSFLQYVRESNSRLGTRQLRNLEAISNYLSHTQAPAEHIATRNSVITQWSEALNLSYVTNPPAFVE